MLDGVLSYIGEISDSCISALITAQLVRLYRISRSDDWGDLNLQGDCFLNIFEPCAIDVEQKIELMPVCSSVSDSDVVYQQFD